MNEIVEIKVLQDYNIWFRFNDKTEKIINIKPYIGKGFTKELLNYENFKKVRIDEGGGITWENGYDICPNYLKDLKTSKGEQYSTFSSPGEH